MATTMLPPCKRHAPPLWEEASPRTHGLIVSLTLFSNSSAPLIWSQSPRLAPSSIHAPHCTVLGFPNLITAPSVTAVYGFGSYLACVVLSTKKYGSVTHSATKEVP